MRPGDNVDEVHCAILRGMTPCGGLPRRSLPEGKWVRTDRGWAVWAKGAQHGWRRVRAMKVDGSSTVERVTHTIERASGCLFFVASRKPVTP